MFKKFILACLLLYPSLLFSDASPTATSKDFYRSIDMNRYNIYRPTHIYMADSSANTMDLVAPDLADDNTVFKLPADNGDAGEFLKTDGSGNTSWDSPPSSPDKSYEIRNHALAVSVAANALTIALKNQAGDDPSAGDPVQISFRDGTLATGTYDTVSITGALSMTISSGATLGTTNGDEAYLYVYALNNSGTAELGVINGKMLDEGIVQSATDEADDGSADSAEVLYDENGRADVPIRLLGRIKITEATAGTWASGATAISLLPFGDQRVVVYFSTNAGSTYNGGGIVDFEDELYDTHGAVTGEGTGVGNWLFTAPRKDCYNVSSSLTMASMDYTATDRWWFVIRANSSDNPPSVQGGPWTAMIVNAADSNAGYVQLHAAGVMCLNKGDTIVVLLSEFITPNATLHNSGPANYISIYSLGGI